MSAPALRPLARRRFVWLLWIALLAPIAQTAATWHALSHLRTTRSHDGVQKQAFHEPRCDLCLAGAAVHGGALPGQPPPLPLAAARHGASSTDPGPTRVVLLERRYESRAPPSALQ